MGEIGIGILIGLGLAIFGRKGAKPIIKGTIKAGIIASETMEDAYHEGKEVITDLVAEAKQESAAYRAAMESAIEEERRRGPISN